MITTVINENLREILQEMYSSADVQMKRVVFFWLSMEKRECLEEVHQGGLYTNSAELFQSR